MQNRYPNDNGKKTCSRLFDLLGIVCGNENFHVNRFPFGQAIETIEIL